MPYATINQLIEAYGHAEVAELLCDEEQLVTETTLQAKVDDDITGLSAEEQTAINTAWARGENILARQSVFIDSKIGIRFTLPLSDPSATPVVECCLALSRAALADDGDNISTTIKEERKHWRAWLNDIASGNALLTGETQGSIGGTVNGHHCAPIPSAVDWDSYS